ncbi:ankyrin repeat domain protein, related [Neospora caninum Liverpool]|uniref:Ankyrin repeat domain protein, related n=1 Tax=Neospora caninum (strain Liverpool) TaxID=572307 RepID=F0VAT2_NEOCL|nr:ankyrin repeat domain protein, related [Neospora caninum Liverpool]CBZ51340.1 ankyrin repeat domain protein, related [Neospora caninum Liverpool]|eukprot:XP_003881373.1 ankyrin repeat domain protein, related [Neospora caninum Liverpool]
MEAGRKLVLAARDGKLRDCKELLKLLPAIDFAEPPLMRTAFWHAAWKGHEAVCRLLLEKGAAINHQDFEGRTPLHEAAHHGHAHIVKFLLENNAAIDLPDAIVEILLKGGAETNFVTPDELTSFHFAAFEGSPELAKYLYYKGSWRNRFSLQERIEAERAEQLIADQSSLSAERTKPEGVVAAEATDTAGDLIEAASLEKEAIPVPEADQEKEQEAEGNGQNRTPESAATRLSSFGGFDDTLEDGNHEVAERSIHSVDSVDHARETEGEADEGTDFPVTGSKEAEKGEQGEDKTSAELDDGTEEDSRDTGDVGEV